MNTQRNKLLLNLGVLGKQRDVSDTEDLKNLTSKMLQSTEESETDKQPIGQLEGDDQDVSYSKRRSCESLDVETFKIIGDTTFTHIIEDLQKTNLEWDDIHKTCLHKEIANYTGKILNNNNIQLLQRARSSSPEPVKYCGDTITSRKVRAKSAPPKVKTYWLYSALLLKKVSIGRSSTPSPPKKNVLLKERPRTQSLPRLLTQTIQNQCSNLEDNNRLRLVTPEPNRNSLNLLLSPRSGSSFGVATTSSIESSAFEASSECSTPSIQTGRKKRKKHFIDSTKKRRKTQKDNWIDTRRKLLLDHGKKHLSRNGNEQPDKNLRAACNNKCKLKCNTNFSDAKRKEIFNQFWALGDHQKQWIFIGKNTKRYKKKRITTDSDSKRQFSVYYYLPSPDNGKIKVCKTMFKNTLSISNQFIQSGIDKYDNLTGNCSKDLRGAHGNKTRVNTDAVVKSVCDHVNSFQPIESHYTRKDSNKLYLDNNLNFTIMFKMYKTWAAERTLTKMFFMPKKDQCDVCTAYKNNPDEDEDIYQAHQNNKIIARSLKTEDKNHALAKPNITAATFDFQKILSTPHGETSSFYYKRKLSVFNFTVFDMGQKKGICYMWDETTAKRGSNEVASCLYDFIRSRAAEEGINDVRLWSDNCGEQNRNRIIFFMYLLASRKFNVTICHRFLEKGHTQQEGDSVHALIERTAKRKMIYSPQEWYTCVRWCKTTNDKYEVIEISKDNILDFKSCINQMNWTKGSNNEKVKWNQVREIKVDVNRPNVIFYKYDLSEQESLSIDCLGQSSNTRTRSNTRQRVARVISEPAVLYSDSLSITAAKYKDLMSLCNQNLIPKNYHNFYKNLKYDENANKSDVSDTELIIT